MVFEMKVDVGGYGSETKAQRDQGCEPHCAIIFKSRLDSLLVEKLLQWIPEVEVENGQRLLM